MKNLVRVGERRRRLEAASGSSTSSAYANSENDFVVDLCTAVTDDVHSGVATVALTAQGIVTSMNEDGETLWVSDLRDVDEACGGGGWFDIAYIDPELVCLSRNGAMATVVPSTGEAELIGAFDYGLEAASWSPDGEVLLMVTSAADDDEEEPKKKSVLMTMNSQFEVMAEITIPDYLASHMADNLGVSVAWRPDGSLCAMSAVDAEDNVRKVRVYKRETLELHAVGRTEDASGAIVKNLQDSGLSWASSGCSQILAAVQRKGKKTQQVAFFESNGLRHREFALREAPTTNVTSLTWNAVSDLLGITLEEEDGTHKVQLWHRCNYHWYMKQEFRYPNQSIQMMKFNEEKAYEFCVVLHGMEWREYIVRWDSSTTLATDVGCPAFVVDGSSLNVTLLDKALIPPPMFLKNVIMEYPIVDITFCRGTSKEYLLLQLSSGELFFLSLNEGTDFSTSKIVPKSGSADTDWSSIRSITAVVDIASGTMKAIGVIPAADGGSETVAEMMIEIEGSGATIDILKTIVLDSRVLRIINWLDDANGCLLEMVDGSFLEYEILGAEASIQPSEVEPLLEPCPWLCAIKDPSLYAVSDHGGHSRMIFGLSARSRLYFHDIMLTDSASSFYISLQHEFLCYATNSSRCFIRFLPLKEISGFDPLMGLDQNHLLEGYEPRAVERGARIVGILPSHPMVILQMPRGNLEGIYPRALVLRYVMLKVHQGEYGDAFIMMRKHKVDLNVLVDFDPWYFYETGIASMFRQVTNIDHLNLFLSGLQDYDTTQNRFPVPLWLRRGNQEIKDRSLFDFSTKVNKICEKARSIMLEMESSGERSQGHFLLPVLSTFAKESPHRLGEGLTMIKARAMEQQIPNSKKPPLFAEKAQSAIHYLAFLAEYELLFETSLGMYDFEIARAVARNSQMDPKIYLPLLKRYNALPRSYAKFEVDMRLKRYENALRNLYESSKTSECLDAFEATENVHVPFGNTFEDCMKLVEKHKLHRLAIHLYEAEPSKIRTLLVSLGKVLLEDRNAEVALSVFLAAKPQALDEATRAAKDARDWRTYFSLIVSKNSFQDGDENMLEQQRQVARDIAREVIAQKTEFSSISKRVLHSDAARILLDYGNDVVGAVDVLINAQNWNEAHRVAALHSRVDLIKKVKDGAIEYARHIVDDSIDKVENFETTSKRYSEVLLLRKKNIVEEGPVAEDADDNGSLFSAASNMSNMSLQSGASTSSTGSATSSIISVKTATTFTMTNNDNAHRHRSKFNKGKKEKKTKKQKNRRRPGSQEELNALVFALKGSCADREYAETISETIRYLVNVQELLLASEMFQRYNEMIESISTIQHKRIDDANTIKQQAQENIGRMAESSEDDGHVLFELPEEKVVDALSCAPLQSSLQELFGYLSLS